MASNPDLFPKPSQIYQGVIIATQNESYEIMALTVKALLESTFDSQKIILVLGYEERGG